MFSQRRSYEPIKLYANLEIITDVDALSRCGFGANAANASPNEGARNVDPPKMRPDRPPVPREPTLPRLVRRRRVVPVAVTNVDSLPSPNTWRTHRSHVDASVRRTRPTNVPDVTPRVPKNWYSRYRTDLPDESGADSAYESFDRRRLHVTNVELPPLRGRDAPRRPAATRSVGRDGAADRLYAGRVAGYRDETVAATVETFRTESRRTNTPKAYAFDDVSSEENPTRCEKVQEWFGRGERRGGVDAADDDDDDAPLYTNNASTARRKWSRTFVTPDVRLEQKVLRDRQRHRDTKTQKYVSMLKTISRRIDRLNSSLSDELAPAKSDAPGVDAPDADAPDAVERKSAVKFRSVEQVLSTVVAHKSDAAIARTPPEDSTAPSTVLADEEAAKETVPKKAALLACDCGAVDVRRRDSETQTKRVEARRRDDPEKSVQTEERSDVQSRLTPRSRQMFRDDFVGGKRVICDCVTCVVEPPRPPAKTPDKRPAEIDTEYLQSRAQAIHERLSGTLEDLYETIVRSEHLKKELGADDAADGGVDAFVDAVGSSGEACEAGETAGATDATVIFDRATSRVGGGASSHERVERTIDYRAIDSLHVVEPESETRVDETTYFDRIDALKRSGAIRIDGATAAAAATAGVVATQSLTARFGETSAVDVRVTKCRCRPKIETKRCACRSKR